MSHHYNPYPTEQRSSAQVRYGHSRAQVQSDPQRTSHPYPGSSYESAPSADLHSSRAREQSLHLPRSYAATQPSQGHRKAVAESSDRSLDWLPTFKSINEDDASKYYTSAASSIFSGGGERRFTTIDERKPHEQSIPGLGECEFSVRETASTQPDISQPKYTSELARNVLLHFGLEKEDLEQLISYPEDQITPQNLPFILRQIRQQKTNNPVSAVQAAPYPEPKPTISANFRCHMREVSHQDYRQHGIFKSSKVIDYGHIGQFSAGPVEEVGMASGAHSVGSSTLLMDNSGRETKDMSISSLISSLDQESSVPGLNSPFSFQMSSNTLPIKNPHQPLNHVSKVPEPKQKQQQQPAAQRSPTPQVDTASTVPAPAQMYDYAAITPGMYPHSCSLCNKECFSVKEWINHQNTELHLENCKLLRTRFPEWDGELLTSLSASDVYTRSSTTRPSQSRNKWRNSSSRSRSRSYSPQRHRGSGSRRDQERSRYRSRSRSRSYSPRQSFRWTHRSRTRSRSQSPLYHSTTSRHRPSPRRRDDRRSSVKTSQSGERRSSEKSSTEKLSKKAAADRKQKTGLTPGEMMEENLLMKRITCVDMKSVFSPVFASKNRRVLQITNLPKYENVHYTERDVANLLTPFGFQHEDEDLHNIYVIPQKRMAFAVLPYAEMAINVIRASVKDCFKLSGCELIVKILEDNFSTPIEFYKSLMMWMNEKIQLDQLERFVFIKNISPREARNLREVLKKMGNVTNYVPLLNKVFIEFYWMHEADRLGVWYSLLRQSPQHFIYRLGTPRNKVTALRPDEPTKALPDLSLRVTDADVPAIPFIPLGCSPPFYVTMTTFPFIFPTACPWFNIPSHQDSSKVILPSRYSTIMMTGLPEDDYRQLHVARMVWSKLDRYDIQSLFYRVMVLPLQRRAFIYFKEHELGWAFSRRHIAKPFCIKSKPVKIHFVNDIMNPEFTEETMYRQLMKLSNAHVPPLSGLDQRLLVVQVSEVSLELIQAVMKEVASVGRLAGFLPLGNRICIEMLEPSDRMKVMEAELGSLTPSRVWKKVTRVDTVQSLHQHQLQLMDPHWVAPDQTAQDSNTSPSSSIKPGAATMAHDSGSSPKTSKNMWMVQRRSWGAVNADSKKSSCTECKSKPGKEESSATDSKDTSPNNSLSALSAVGLTVSAENTAAEPADGKVAEPSVDWKQKTGLTMGEMLEENLLLERITCVDMKSVLSPEFASENRRVLQITNLPKYEAVRYTEQDVANLLTPFGFHHEDERFHNIYVIPQKRMALVVLPTAEMVINVIRASMKDCFKLYGCKLTFKILKDKISTPIVFYRILMMWMNEKLKSHDGKHIVFIKNISPSEVRNLRNVLKKIGDVINYVPLLNKVFIHFSNINEVDRFGIWYSLLRHPPQYYIYRLVTPQCTTTTQLLHEPARALPDISLRVLNANCPTISSIPLGCIQPFFVTMKTFPFVFPTLSPWFNIPSHQESSTVKMPSHYSTIMMTNLPVDGYCQLDVARMVWSHLQQRNINSLFYKVMVLPLQRRAFLYFNDPKSCWAFSRLHIAKPFCIKNIPVNIHFLTNNMNPGFTEETMYRQLMKLSNAHVPPLSGLDQRLLVVQVSEVSLKLIQAIVKEVASVGPLAGFLPLGNRICIEMLEPSDRMKVMEAELGSLTASHIWEKVICLHSVQSLHEHQLKFFDVTIILEEDPHGAVPDQTAQDSTTSSSSLTKPSVANTVPDSGSAPETSEEVEMVEHGSSGAVDADSNVSNSDDLTRIKKLPEGPTPSEEHPEGVKASVEHPEGKTPSEKYLEEPTPSEEHLKGPKPTEELPEGSTLSKECSEGLAPSKEWCEGLTSSEKHLESPTQSKVYLECMMPFDKCPESATPSEEQSKSPTPSQSLSPSEKIPQDPTPTEKPPQGPTLSVEKLEGSTRSEECPEGATTSKQPKTEIKERPPMGEDKIKAILAAIQQYKQAKGEKVSMGFTSDVRFSDRSDLRSDQDKDKFVTLDEVSNDTKDTAKNTQSSNSSMQQSRRRCRTRSCSKTSEQESNSLNKSDKATERSHSPSSSQRRQRDSCTTAAREKSRSPKRRSHHGRNKSRSLKQRSHHSRDKSWSPEGKPYRDMDYSPTSEQRSHCGKDKSPSNESKENSSCTEPNSQPSKDESSGTESKERSLNTESKFEQEKSPNSSLAALSAVGLMVSAENTAAEPERETPVEAPKEEETSVTQSLKSEKQVEEMENDQILDLIEENGDEDEEYQLPRPEKDPRLDGLSFQGRDSIDDEGMVHRENESGEPQPEISYQELDSVTEDQSGTDQVTDVAAAENVSAETKMSNIAKRPRRGRGGKRGRKPNVLAAKKDTTDQEILKVIDSVKSPTETEDPEPTSQAPKDVTPEAELEPIKAEEVYQVIDLVDEQSAPSCKKKQGHRGRPTRRSARGRTSEEKQDEAETKSEVTKPDSITNKEGAEEVPCRVLDSVRSDTIQETQKVVRRRSTRGNKEEKITSQTASNKEEPKYQVIHSVEEVGKSEEVAVTRATGGRRGWPAKRDIPTWGQTAAKEKEEGKETSPKVEETAVTVEEVADKAIDSVEDEGAPDAPPVSGQKRNWGRLRNVKTTSKPVASKKAKVEIEEEPTYQIIDSVEEEAAKYKEISDDPGTAEKSSTPEEDYDKQKITKSVCEENKEKPTYQIVDFVEDDQGQEETEDDPVPDNMIPGTVESSTEEEVEQKDYTNLTEDKNHEFSTMASAHVILDKEAKELEMNNEAPVSQSSSIGKCRSKEMEIPAFEAKELLTLDEVGADEAPEEGEEDGSERIEEGDQEEQRNRSNSSEYQRRKEMKMTVVDIQDLQTLDKVDDALEKRETCCTERKEELNQESDVRNRISSREGQRRKEVEMDQVDIKELLTLDEVGADDVPQQPKAEGPETKEELPICDEGKDRPISESGQSLDPLKSETLADVDEEKDDDHRHNYDITVVGKRRKELMGPEAKRSCSQSPDVPADFTLLTYIPGNPLGQEFVVPKTGFFCNVCSISFVNENTTKEVHCSSRIHFDNLKKYYLKLKTTPSRASSPTSSNVSSDAV